MPYIQDSMELNLFFLRILKEHALFMQLSFTPRDKELADRAAELRTKLEDLMQQAIRMSKGYISETVMSSGELFTPYTEEAERQTEFFTSVPVNTQLTREEYDLGGGMTPPPGILPQVTALNQNALMLARQMLQFNQSVLDDVLACRMFTVIYPSELEHLVNEAQNYIAMLTRLISGAVEMAPREFALQQAFWNENMGQHAQYIEGSLDPTESALQAQAAAFAREFARLVQQAQTAEQRLQILPQVTMRSEAATERIQRYKAEGTEGILSCSVRSIIIPLLADHVLREANYYLRMLRENMQ
jgi:hypothetical protein